VKGPPYIRQKVLKKIENVTANRRPKFTKAGNLKIKIIQDSGDFDNLDSRSRRVFMPQKSKPSLDASEFASSQVALLEKERLAEVAEVSDAITVYSPSQLQARGLALLNLLISSVRTGLGGKTYGPFPYEPTF
jgi:hypothetical protein